MEDGGADTLGDGGREGGCGGVTQNQNGIFQSCLAQFHGFQHGTDTEKGAFVLQKPCHLNGTVTVSVGFDHGHYRNACLFPNRIKVPFNGIQTDLYPCAVEIQDHQLACNDFSSF